MYISHFFLGVKFSNINYYKSLAWVIVKTQSRNLLGLYGAVKQKNIFFV